jgi:Ran GTPase-activating protein (RanGAP) involved in mRNA processing and transport
MIDAIIDKPIVELNLSHNAFGPDGVTAYVDFLEKCSTLKILNVTNCGLGPKGSQMIAEAILKNDEMRLTEFSASRDRLENPGIEALSKVFSAHGTLKKIEVY